MSVLMALPAAGAVLVSMILSVSAPRLCTLLATSATKALNLLKLAMRSSLRWWVMRRMDQTRTQPSDRADRLHIRAQKSPARFPARAHFVSFNLPNSLICDGVSSGARRKFSNRARMVDLIDHQPSLRGEFSFPAAWKVPVDVPIGVSREEARRAHVRVLGFHADAGDIAAKVNFE